MDYKIERPESVECCKCSRNLFFGIFAGRVEGSDVAVTESRPCDWSALRFKLAYLAVKVEKAESLAESSSLVMGFMIPGKTQRRSPKGFKISAQRSSLG